MRMRASGSDTAGARPAGNGGNDRAPDTLILAGVVAGALNAGTR